MTERARTSPSFRKRVSFWSTLALGTVILFFVLLVLIAPRAINRDAVRTRIEATISKELGGTVTYDRADLVVIPRPMIEFRNMKIEVPAGVSATFATVRIYAGLLPLLHGRFEVSSVTIDRPALALVLTDSGTKRSKRAKEKTPQTALTVNSVLAVAGRTMPDLSLSILRGSLSLIRNSQKALSLEDLDAVLAFVPEAQNGQGDSNRSSDERYHIMGKAQAVVDGIAALPGPLTISIAQFDAYPKSLVVARSRARLLDMDITLAGSVEDYLSNAPRSDIVFNGSIGKNTAVWIRTLAGLPDDVTIRTPLKVKDVRLRSSVTGLSLSESLAGNIMVKDGATISFALRHEPDHFAVERLKMKDSDSDVSLRLSSCKEDLDLEFNGTLKKTTISTIIDLDHVPFRLIKGDIRLHLRRNRWIGFTAEGAFEGEGIIIPSLPDNLLIVDRFSARSHGRSIDLRPVVISLGHDIMTAEGTATMTDTGVALDLDVSAARINMAAFQALLKGKKTENGSTTAPNMDKKLSVEGDLRLRADVVTLPSYTAQTVTMTISKTGDQITADLEHASICGIYLDGTLQADDQGMEMSLNPRASGGKLDESLRCILHEDLGVSGDYDLSGHLTGSGPLKSFPRSLHGNLDFTARQGRIHNDKVVHGVIEYLNSTSLLKGSHSSLLKEGVPYETIVLRGALREGTITLAEGSVKSKDLFITAEGTLDLSKDNLALNVLVAPFSRLDRLLSKIPIVKDIAGNALVVVPVRVEGTFNKPKVKPLPVSAVGMNVTNLMKNIVQAPVKIVEPVIPKGSKKVSNTGKDSF